jgi:cell division protease FtsH
MKIKIQSAIWWTSCVPFSASASSKNKAGMPGKTRFSIWYFVFAMIFFSYLQQLLFLQKQRRFPTANLNNMSTRESRAKLTIGPENINGTLAGSPKERLPPFG